MGLVSCKPLILRKRTWVQRGNMTFSKPPSYLMAELGLGHRSADLSGDAVSPRTLSLSLSHVGRCGLL